MRKILIHALGAASPGAVRHLEGFLPALDAVSRGSHFELYLRRSVANGLKIPSLRNLTIRTVPDLLSGPMANRLLLDLVAFPLMTKFLGFDLIVTLANFGPVWTTIPHAVFQRNAIYYSPEYLKRVRGLKWAAAILRKRLAIATIRRASLVITPSRAMADLIRQQCKPLAHVPFETLPHGVDLEEFAARSDHRRRGPVDPFVFLYPTKQEIYKGLDVLLEAIPYLRKSIKNFRILVTTREHGWPREIAIAIALAKQRGDLEHVQFVGAKSSSEMGALYRSVDAMVYPSLCESFGFPLVEAMATGTPIVAADLDVNREVCGDAALYYAAKHPESCAEAMKRLTGDADLLEQLVGRAQQRLREQNWTWEANAIHFFQLCAKAIESRGS